MKNCLNCEKEFKNQREAAKFCSAKCRVMWNRKNPSNGVSKVQMQVLYNSLMEAVGKLNEKGIAVPLTAVSTPKGYFAPTTVPQPQTALKTFDQWREAKRECELPEDWEKIRVGIQSATNLSQKQKDLLIKYS